MDVNAYLTKCGFKTVTVEKNGVECCIVVKDENIKEPELKPVAIGGKLVTEE